MRSTIVNCPPHVGHHYNPFLPANKCHCESIHELWINSKLTTLHWCRAGGLGGGADELIQLWIDPHACFFNCPGLNLAALLLRYRRKNSGPSTPQQSPYTKARIQRCLLRGLEKAIMRLNTRNVSFSSRSFFINWILMRLHHHQMLSHRHHNHHHYQHRGLFSWRQNHIFLQI